MAFVVFIEFRLWYGFDMESEVNPKAENRVKRMIRCCTTGSVGLVHNTNIAIECCFGSVLVRFDDPL